jgi:MFS family permease
MSDLWQFALLGFLLSVAATIAGVALNAVVGDLYRNRRGLAYGSLNMSTSLGSVIGALVSGLLYTTGWDKLVITSVTVQVISLLALLLLWKTYLPYDVLREKPVITVITPKE